MLAKMSSTFEQEKGVVATAEEHAKLVTLFTQLVQRTEAMVPALAASRSDLLTARASGDDASTPVDAAQLEERETVATAQVCLAYEEAMLAAQQAAMQGVGLGPESVQRLLNSSDAGAADVLPLYLSCSVVSEYVQRGDYATAQALIKETSRVCIDDNVDGDAAPASVVDVDADAAPGDLGVVRTVMLMAKAMTLRGDCMEDACQHVKDRVNGAVTDDVVTDAADDAAGDAAAVADAVAPADTNAVASSLAAGASKEECDAWVRSEYKRLYDERKVNLFVGDSKAVGVDLNMLADSMKLHSANPLLQMAMKQLQLTQYLRFKSAGAPGL
jgi:hypothetical protein